MSKKEEFKSFVSSHPNLVNVVSSKKRSWQDLFEVFDLYGNDEDMWNRYLNNIGNVRENNKESITELTKLFKNINIDSVQKYIETAQKAIGIVQELTGSKATDSVVKGPINPRPINKIFED